MPEKSSASIRPLAAIYCRISRDAEGDEVGVRRQERECRELAARLGFEVGRVFTDNDAGASEQTRKSKKRPQYQEMLNLVREGQFSVVLAYSNSRLTRRLMELQDLVELAGKPTFLKIHTVVSGDTDLSTADGLMVARIKASVDAAESQRISERSRAAYLSKALEGKPRLTGHRAFGWNKDRLTLDPFESNLVREGIHDLIRGVPLNAIRLRWEAEGVRTPSGGTEWHWSNMKDVLTRWRVAGVSTYKKEPQRHPDGSFVMGNWEPIVSVQELERAVAQINSRTVKRVRHGKYALSGIVWCECGRRMWGNFQPSGPRSSQYSCSQSSRHISITAHRLEEYVFLELYARLLNRQLQGETVSEEHAPEEFPGEARLASITDKVAELMDAFNSDKLTGDVVFPSVEKLQKEAGVLRRERDEWLAQQSKPKRDFSNPEDIINFVKEFDSRPVEEKKAVLTQELSAVVIYKGQRGVSSRTREAFEKRIKLAWRD